MIARIVGDLYQCDLIKDNIYEAIIMDNGIGYQVFVNEDLFESPYFRNALCKFDLFIHTNVRENSIELFGFVLSEELKMFKELIKINGIGAKTALIILTKGYDLIYNAVRIKDKKFFENISGIGEKTAQNIIQNFK